MKRLDKTFAITIMLIFGLVIFSLGHLAGTVPAPEEDTAIVNSTQLAKQQVSLNLKLDQVIGVLVDELYEEKKERAICEEAVSRWASDARTRQEVKNEAKRLKQKKKKGKTK